MGMLLHRTLMEQEEKGKGKVTKLADLQGKEKQEEKVEKPTTKKKK